MKVVKLIWYGVPYCVLLIIGGVAGLAADLTDWRWLERLELYLREIVERMEATLARI